MPGPGIVPPHPSAMKLRTERGAGKDIDCNTSAFGLGR